MPRPFLSRGETQLFLVNSCLFYRSDKIWNLKGNIDLSYFVITLQTESICDVFYLHI